MIRLLLITKSAGCIHKLRLRVPDIITIVLQLDRSNSVTLRRHHASFLGEQIKHIHLLLTDLSYLLDSCVERVRRLWRQQHLWRLVAITDTFTTASCRVNTQFTLVCSSTRGTTLNVQVSTTLVTWGDLVTP